MIDKSMVEAARQHQIALEYDRSAREIGSQTYSLAAEVDEAASTLRHMLAGFTREWRGRVFWKMVEGFKP